MSTELEEYKAKVRERLIEEKASWSPMDDLNDLLTDLSLKPVETDWQVTVYVTVKATSADNACDKAYDVIGRIDEIIDVETSDAEELG